MALKGKDIFSNDVYIFKKISNPFLARLNFYQFFCSLSISPI